MENVLNTRNEPPANLSLKELEDRDKEVPWERERGKNRKFVYKFTI